MIFSGTLSKYATVTVGGNPASLDASNNFRGAATVTTGTNNVPIIAQDVDGNVATNTYQVVVPPGSGSSYTYDLNGNMLTDGTHTFGWDAKNELVSIIYNSGPNSGNHTEFTYNGAGERVNIVERTGTTIGSGTITSTKQYVWVGGGLAEERNATNKVTKRYFAQGVTFVSGSTGTNYFYTRDHLGSIRELMASNGTTISARYSYDPFGRATQVSGSISSDLQYAGMYLHADSTSAPTVGFNLTKYRAYNPNLGRWISRDPYGEGSGLNLYAYCAGNPINNIDPEGAITLAQAIRIGYSVLWFFWNSVFFWAGGTGPQPPPQLPRPPGTVQPGEKPHSPISPTTPDDEDQCPEDNPPDAPPAPVPIPVLPSKQATAAEEAELAEEAEIDTEEAEILTGLLEADEVILTTAVIIK